MHNKILFLDIDGVLNYFEYTISTHSSFHPILMERLNRIIRETECEVCLSSSWKYWGFEETKQELLKFGMSKPIMDYTPFEKDLETPHTDRKIYHSKLKRAKESVDRFDIIRGDEVHAWLSKNPTERYCILDDYPEFLDYQYPFFIQTNPHTGLTESDTQKAIAILNNS